MLASFKTDSSRPSRPLGSWGSRGVNGHWDTNKDSILINLRRILLGKVGSRLEFEEETEAREEARRRIAEKILRDTRTLARMILVVTMFIGCKLFMRLVAAR